MENQLNARSNGNLPFNNKADRYLLIFLGFATIFCLAIMAYFIANDPASILKNNNWVALLIGFSVIIPIFKRFISRNKQEKPTAFLQAKDWGTMPLHQKILVVIGLAFWIPLLLFIFACFVWGVLTNFN